jgi:hypothetical protein
MNQDADYHSVAAGESTVAAPTKEKQPTLDLTTPPTQRRSIFANFWKRSPSSILCKDSERIVDGEGESDKSTEARYENKQPPMYLEPSYLGVYNFSPSVPAAVSQTPSSVSPASSSKNLVQSPKLRPKSILHRHHSLRASYESHNRSSDAIFGRSKSDFATVPPPPFLEDTSEESRSIDSEPRKTNRSSVHFDPTITVREVVDRGWSEESSWFSDSELQAFMRQAVNLSYSSAVHGLRTYSQPALVEAIAAAHKAGVEHPVMSQARSHSECRSLFTDKILSASDDDLVVHDCSKDFFKVIRNEVRGILIVDNSITSLKLFKRHLLSMFPEAQVLLASSGEEALKLFDVHCDSDQAPSLDIIIVEQNLPTGTVLEDDHSESSNLSGSDLLAIINFVEKHNPDKRRRSLKIGVSVNLSEDCESLLRSGSDLFWCKPPPKQTNSLRNQILNSLLSKRDKNIFICDC